MNRVNTVAMDTPNSRVMPSTLRVSAPAPNEMTSGTAPASVVMVVMMIGRKRTAEASVIASSTDLPWSRSWLANSTISMPFLAARPISITMPIWL